MRHASPPICSEATALPGLSARPCRQIATDLATGIPAIMELEFASDRSEAVTQPTTVI